jgi:CPA1 family monovalent cation:H+ antiporter
MSAGVAEGTHAVADIPVGLITGIVFFILISALSAVVLRKLKFPYTVGLMIVGVVLGLLAPNVPLLESLHRVRLTPHLILYVFLPTLLFEAALGLDVALLRRNLAPVLTLAVPGLVLATAITGVIVAALTPLALGPALLFGALISATDPVAVIALFREFGAPKRLAMLVDGESLFNDATAIVAFKVLLGVVAAGAMGAATWLRAGGEFAVVFAGGLVAGVAVGWVITRLLRISSHDPLLQIALTTVAAYASFILAEFFLHLSGVMAVVGAGMVVGGYGASHFTAEIKASVHHFWAYASFLCNSFIFLLLGFTEALFLLNMDRIRFILLMVWIAIVAVLAARAAVVFGLSAVVNRVPGVEGVNRAEQKVLVWGALRGALPIGLALTIPAAALGEHGEDTRLTLLGLVLGVVLFSLLVQGTTMGRLLRRLHLTAS